MFAAPYLTLGSASSASADVGLWVGIALESTPADVLGNAAFTDISDLVVSFDITSGRQYELDQIDTGVCNLLLNSPDGVMDPANVDSPYYPNLRPLRPIRILKHTAGNIYYRFTGPIERFEPKWMTPRNDSEGVPGVQQMAITADDGFEILSNRYLVSSNYATLTTALTGANNDLTFTAVDSGPNGNSITVEYAITGASAVLDAGTNNPYVGNTVAFVPPRLQHGRGTPPQSVPPSDVTVTGTDITINVATNGATVVTSSANDVLAAMQASPEISRLVTVALAPGSTGAGLVIEMAQTPLMGGEWPAEASGARLERALDLASWPAAARQIDDGVFDVTQGGYGRADRQATLQHLQDVAQGELGYVFMDTGGAVVFHDGDHRGTAPASTTSQATYSDDGVGFPYYGQPGLTLDRDRIYNDVTVTSGSTAAVPQNAADTDSQAEFETRSYAMSTLLAADADALTVADAILAAYKDPPSIRFTTINLIDLGNTGSGDATLYGSGLYDSGTYGAIEGSDAWLQGVLARQIGDRVTVRTNPPGHTTTIAYDCFIEAISDTVGPGGAFNDGQQWETQFMLTPISASASGGGGGGGDSGGALYDGSTAIMVLDTGALG